MAVGCLRVWKFGERSGESTAFSCGFSGVEGSKGLQSVINQDLRGKKFHLGEISLQRHF